MTPVRSSGLLGLLKAGLLASFFTLSLSQTPPVSPDVASMAMWGNGCPVGAAGLIQQIRNGTPVFSFTEWNLTLPSPEALDGAISKFCVEEIGLANGPVGMQLRIAKVSVLGWADLDEGTEIVAEAVATLEGAPVAKQIAGITRNDMEGNNFEITLTLDPDNAWSSCVDASGTVPHISIKTTVWLVGTERGDGSYTGGVLGGDKSDLKKALGVHFDPEWKSC